MSGRLVNDELWAEIEELFPTVKRPSLCIGGCTGVPAFAGAVWS